MPILRGAVTFSRFTAEHTKTQPKDPRRSLANAIRGAAFEPLERSGENDKSSGWVELEDIDATELPPSRFLYGSYLLATWRIDQIKVPAPLLRQEVDAWARQYEEKLGYPPKRADKSSEKEMILKRLRKRAFIATRTHDVSWNLDTNAVQIWSASKAAIEEIQIAIEECFGVKLTPTSPGARADADGVDSKLLKPTAALFGDDVAREVKSDG